MPLDILERHSKLDMKISLEIYDGRSKVDVVILESNFKKQLDEYLECIYGVY